MSAGMKASERKARAKQDVRRFLERPWFGSGNPIDKACRVLEECYRAGRPPEGWAFELASAWWRGEVGKREAQHFRKFMIGRAVRIAAAEPHGYPEAEARRIVGEVMKELKVDRAEETLRSIWKDRPDEEPPGLSSVDLGVFWCRWRHDDAQCAEAARELEATHRELLDRGVAHEVLLDLHLELLAAHLIDNFGGRGALVEIERVAQRAIVGLHRLGLAAAGPDGPEMVEATGIPEAYRKAMRLGCERVERLLLAAGDEPEKSP